jgi:protein tyrosine phosphatase (PTP) superfamily phosphohydrolase (DUF442 family)
VTKKWISPRPRTGFLSLVLLLAAFATPALAAPPRPQNWASAVAGSHVPNLYRVEPDLLRSAQPDVAGFKELSALGIKSVLDLRAGHADARDAGATVLRFLHIPMRAWSLHDDQVVAALKILADKSNRPLLVHCQKGADRTGAILALYRVVVQGWTKEDALKEMNEGGFHHSSFFRNLDRYVARADIPALRKQLAIALPVVPAAAVAAASPAPAHSPIPETLTLLGPRLIPLGAAAPR